MARIIYFTAVTFFFCIKLWARQLITSPTSLGDRQSVVCLLYFFFYSKLCSQKCNEDRWTEDFPGVSKNKTKRIRALMRMCYLQRKPKSGREDDGLPTQTPNSRQNRWGKPQQRGTCGTRWIKAGKTTKKWTFFSFAEDRSDCTLETPQCHREAERQQSERRTKVSSTVQVYQSPQQTIVRHQANKLGCDVKSTVQRVWVIKPAPESQPPAGTNRCQWATTNCGVPHLSGVLFQSRNRKEKEPRLRQNVISDCSDAAGEVTKVTAKSRCGILDFCLRCSP